MVLTSLTQQQLCRMTNENLDEQCFAFWHKFLPLLVCHVLRSGVGCSYITAQGISETDLKALQNT